MDAPAVEFPAEERADFPRTGVRARRWYRFERDLRDWLVTPAGRFAAWDAARMVGGESPARSLTVD